MSKESIKKIQKRNSNFWRRLLTKCLILGLRIKSVDVKAYILQALGKIGDDLADPIILDAAKSKDNTIRRFAISALADIGNDRAIDAIIDALNDKESDIRATAAMSLGLLGVMKAEDHLIELLDDKDDSVRTQAIIALGNLRSNKAFTKLNQMTLTETNEWIRRYISQAIIEIEGGHRS